MSSPISADGILIRAFDAERDLDALWRFRADPESAGMGQGWVITPETQEAVLASVRIIQRDGFCWTIADAGEDAAIGVATVRGIDSINRTLWTATSIYEPGRRNRGLGTAARRALFGYIFSEMNYRRIYGQLLDFNAASLRSHEKLGAQVIGRRRQASYLTGRYHDMIQYVHRREIFERLFPPPLRSWSRGDDGPH